LFRIIIQDRNVKTSIAPSKQQQQQQQETEQREEERFNRQGQSDRSLFISERTDAVIVLHLAPINWQMVLFDYNREGHETEEQDELLQRAIATAVAVAIGPLPKPKQQQQVLQHQQ